MSKLLTLLKSAFISTLGAGLFSASAMAETELNIIPLPQKVEQLDTEGFILSKETKITYNTEAGKKSAELLAAALRPATGMALPVAKAGQHSDGNIHFEITNHRTPAKAFYSLQSGEKGVKIMSASSEGLFYASQTVRQLLPTQIFSNKKQADMDWTIPAVDIQDAPSYEWRGMMLDVSRYFFNKEYVLRYLDMMAMHKMNVLHWHLIDDCGWRIEIKKYPKLTSVGAKRGKGWRKHEGYYTQEDIKEIVAYATERHITIVPEIEIPAHTQAALAAYPELGCFNQKLEVPARHFISPNLYCVGKETTWVFLRDVMDEVCDLFPGEYIHIGGDEAKYTNWKKCEHCQKCMKENKLKSEKHLQGWATTKMENYLLKKGKRIIGWDEILDCGVSNKAGIMTWHKPQTAVNGAKRGNPVVMSLVRHTYFDTPESRLPGEPPCATWTPPVTLQKAYDWHPTPKELDARSARNILGANGCVWTDRFLHNADVLMDKPGKGTAASEAYVDYLTLPRMAALAEVTWTKQSKRKYDHFLQRMRSQYPRYTAAGYNFRMPTPLVNIASQSNGGLKVSSITSNGIPVKDGVIRYTTDGTNPTEKSDVLDLSKGDVLIPSGKDFKTATFALGKQSLTFSYIDPMNKWAKFGKKFGEWNSGKVGNKKPKEVTFEATGLINKNGTYEVTFIYTKGEHRLDIDGITVVQNDVKKVAEDKHYGIAAGRPKNNTYTVKINAYETGASYKVKAMIYGDTGDDSNGMVFIKRVK